MMKKLLSLLMIASCAIVANAQTGGTACTPDPQYAGNPGIYPDSATGISPAMVGVAYNQAITVVLPADTTVDFPGVGIVTLTMNYIGVTSVVVLDGTDTIQLADLDFTYACEPSNCQFPGDASGCLVLQCASPALADTGTYQLLVTVTPNVTHALLGTFDAPASVIDDYFIVINGPDAVETLNSSKFEVGQNIPNPANGSTTINFTSPSPSTVDFKIYNMLGMVVKSNKIDAVSGLNKINFNTNELSQGVYVYSITNGNNTITKRMVVSGK